MLTPQRDPLNLHDGCRLMLGGYEWTVASYLPHLGRVKLRNEAGRSLETSVQVLMNDPDCRPSTNTPDLPAAIRGRQPAGLSDLLPHQQDMAKARYAHLMEAETGYRGGSAIRALPGEPRPAYDPGKSTLAERREAKVAELRAMPRDEARMLGMGSISTRTLKRWAGAVRRFGIAGCISGNWVRRTGGRRSVTPELREAIAAVRLEVLHRSRVSMKVKYILVCQFMREKFEPGTPVPSYDTVRRIWLEWYGPGGTRQKYTRSAARQPAGAGEHVILSRPGQVVVLDTTEMTVMVRESVFGEPTPVHLTLAMDAYTHSIVAFRLTLISDTSTDVAMLLRDVMMPLPMRDGWGMDMEWPYAGVPASLVAEFAGYRVAALPFFAPETVTTDHGSVYKNHHLVEVERIIGANILPARVLRPTDKSAVERAFGGIQSLLLEYLLGYRGVDVADRGADPEQDAVLTIAQMEHLIATWVVKIWQNRQLGEFKPAWDPGGKHSPNTLFAAAMSQGGFSLQIPSPDMYFELLRAHHVSRITGRGVNVRGLWYDVPRDARDVLAPYRGVPSSRGGKFKRTWTVHSDPRDRRFAFFRDPGTHEWHTLRWTGLPAEGQIPAFGDARAEELLAAAKASGLRPQSDAELRPLLLDLIGGHIPVDSWPTQLAKKKRKEHAREVLQGQAAASDRAAGRQVASLPRGELAGPAWKQRAQGIASAVDDERRRRRHAAVAAPPAPARPMGSRSGRRNLLAVPPTGLPEARETK
jgi:hypothetical protein